MKYGARPRKRSEIWPSAYEVRNARRLIEQGEAVSSRVAAFFALERAPVRSEVLVSRPVLQPIGVPVEILKAWRYLRHDAEVYRILVLEGPRSIPALAKRTRLARTSVAVILYRLKRWRLIAEERGVGGVGRKGRGTIWFARERESEAA